MNRSIQLHDCEISAVTASDRSTTIVLFPAYIHESTGLPGYDPGRVWHQVATLTFAGTASAGFAAELPVWVLDGVLRIGETRHEGFVPAGCHIEEPTEFSISLSTADGLPGGTFSLRGDGVRIELSGEPSDIGEFTGTPRRSI